MEWLCARTLLNIFYIFIDLISSRAHKIDSVLSPNNRWENQAYFKVSGSL